MDGGVRIRSITNRRGADRLDRASEPVKCAFACLPELHHLGRVRDVGGPIDLQLLAHDDAGPTLKAFVGWQVPLPLRVPARSLLALYGGLPQIRDGSGGAAFLELAPEKLGKWNPLGELNIDLFLLGQAEIYIQCWSGPGASRLRDPCPGQIKH